MFFETLPKVTGTLLGLLLALVGTLYSVRSRRSDSNIQALREKLLDFDQKYNAVLRKYGGSISTDEFDISELNELDEAEFDENLSDFEIAQRVLVKSLEIDPSKEEIDQWANEQSKPALAHLYAHRSRILWRLHQLKNRHSDILYEKEASAIIESCDNLSALIRNHDVKLYVEITGDQPPQDIPENCRSEAILSKNEFFERWLEANEDRIEDRRLSTEWSEETRKGKTIASLAVLFREMKVDSYELRNLLIRANPALQMQSSKQLNRVIVYSFVAGLAGVLAPLLVLLAFSYDPSILNSGSQATILGASLLIITFVTMSLSFREAHKFVKHPAPI